MPLTTGSRSARPLHGQTLRGQSTLQVRTGQKQSIVATSGSRGAFEIVASAQLIAELVDVVARPALARRLDQSTVDALVATLREEAIVVDDPPVARVVRTDPKDDYLVAIAREAGAQVIVSGDRHLLDLERLDPPAMTPAAFLDIVVRIG